MTFRDGRDLDQEPADEHTVACDLKVPALLCEPAKNNVGWWTRTPAGTTCTIATSAKFAKDHTKESSRQVVIAKFGVMDSIHEQYVAVWCTCDVEPGFNKNAFAGDCQILLFHFSTLIR